MAATSTLEGKVAVVSGSNTGIGAAIARELSRRGAHVVIHYPFPSDKALAQHVLDSLPRRHTIKSIIVEADLSTLTGPQTLADAAAAEFRKIDILVNNAGISKLSPLDSLEDEAFTELWDQVVNVNGRGMLLLTRACLKYLPPTTTDDDGGSSRIINICSSQSRDPEPNMCIYAGTKGMVESLTRSWAKDLPRKYGCTVNTVAPGPVATEGVLLSPPEVQEMIRATVAKLPITPRLTEPDEVAWTVAMLCEEQARRLNGLYLTVC
ncbi:hypothetical protein DTO027B5_4667 [Paecilomyces variotii]|nr:hypothetical protein DTO027B3_2081 [Paecilomyces variotii]KAJ9333483.1 hypothetical protein DTO027B5_4667 [Paecilomyces variotii]